MAGRKPSGQRAAPHLAALAAAAWLFLADCSRPAPDLCVEWKGVNRLPIHGTQGEIVELHLRIHNIGSADAFALVLLASFEAPGLPARIEPGPAAGHFIDRSLELEPSPTIEEVCLFARLQTLQRDDPRDPRPADNRICRRLEADARRRCDRYRSSLASEADAGGRSGMH